MFTGQACRMGNDSLTKDFLENFQARKFIDKGDPTPIWHAVNHGHSEVVKLLLRYGCDANKPAPDGTTPKMIAELHDDNATMQMFPDDPKDLKSDSVQSGSGKSSLISLSHIYPKFNQRIENNEVPMHSNIIPVDFCPIKNNWLPNQSLQQFPDRFRNNGYCKQ